MHLWLSTQRQSYVHYGGGSQKNVYGHNKDFPLTILQTSGSRNLEARNVEAYEGAFRDQVRPLRQVDVHDQAQ